MKKNLHLLLLFLMCISASWARATETLERTVVFDMNYHGSQYWRIPALVTAADGTLVAIADKRGSNLGDLPNTISIMARRSTDNGQTWGEPIMIAEGGNGKTYGDAAVVKANNGDLVAMFVGDQGLWNATPSNRQGVYVSKSTDNGLSWSAPRAITDQVYKGHESWYAGFAGSGHGLCLKDGRLMFVMAIRPTWTQYPPLYNYAIYSDDNGENWTLSRTAACTDGDEAKVVELKDGSILMSIRNRNKGQRIFCKSEDKGQTWGTPYFASDLIEPACNGDIIRYESTDTEGKSYLLHSLPNHATTRQDVTIFLSDDEGANWPIKRKLVEGYSAYSSMTVLQDGTIGVLVEEGKWDSQISGTDGFKLVFYRFPLSWLTEQAPENPTVTGTLQLNGTDRYMRIADHDDFNVAIGESYTVTCKVKMPFSNSNCRFVGKRSYTGTQNSGTTGWELWGDMNYSTRFSTNLSPAGSPWGGKGNGTGATFMENQWAHLTWVFDWTNNKTNIYIDGVLKESKELHADFQTKTLENTFDVLVGCGYSNNDGQQSIPSWFMNGEMDDVRFYSKALTADEVKADMTAVVGNTTEGLVAAYDFENISGSTVPDISGHGHDGTLVNFPNYSTMYAITITTPEAAQGTLKVMNGLNEVTSGEKVAENTQLRVTATPASGYKLTQILVNGTKLEGTTFTVTGPTTVAAEFAEATPEYCTYEGNSKHDGRYLKSLTMAGGVNDLTFNVHSTFKQPVYVDKTDQVIEAYAGTEFRPSAEWIGEWMHGYLYIDYDQDYNFNFTYDNDGYPTADEELVSYTFFSPSGGATGKNSKGNSAANNSRLDNIPSFTLPETLQPGDYRVRFKIDWNNADACGHPNETKNLLTDNGGNIIDFTLRIVEKEEPVEKTYIVTLPQYEDVQHGFLSVISPEKFLFPGDNEVKENTVLNISAEPEKGYMVKYVKANDVDITGQKTYTVTGNTVFSVLFVEETHNFLSINVEGEGTVVVTNAEGTVLENGIELPADEVLTITATPSEGYELSTLTVNGEAFTNGETYTANSNVTVAATFVEIPKYALTLTVKGKGNVTVADAEGNTYENGASIARGTEVTITATADETYLLKTLTVNGEAFTSGDKLVVNEALAIEAVFEEDLAVGIDNHETGAMAARYNNGILTVSGVKAGEFSLYIYNLTGKMVKTANETTVNISDMPKGCYIVKIQTNDAEKALKFIKK